ncbi:MAG: FAD-dependent oxidoreductase, partial [Rhizobiales bacterium]|nr:FAD-dependent oxidoreductase [Hyphomicrobiales bacterium]
MGSAAAYHCAKRGANVLGLDANIPNHTLGSSHGATRAIRETYFESPEYVPLCQRSYDLWRELEQNSGKSLLVTNGAIYVGPKGHPLLTGVASAGEQHSL